MEFHFKQKPWLNHINYYNSREYLNISIGKHQFKITLYPYKHNHSADKIQNTQMRFYIRYLNNQNKFNNPAKKLGGNKSIELIDTPYFYNRFTVPYLDVIRKNNWSIASWVNELNYNFKYKEYNFALEKYEIFDADIGFCKLKLFCKQIFSYREIKDVSMLNAIKDYAYTEVKKIVKLDNIQIDIYTSLSSGYSPIFYFTISCYPKGNICYSSTYEEDTAFHIENMIDYLDKNVDLSLMTFQYMISNYISPLFDKEMYCKLAIEYTNIDNIYKSIPVINPDLFYTNFKVDRDTTNIFDWSLVFNKKPFEEKDHYIEDTLPEHYISYDSACEWGKTFISHKDKKRIVLKRKPLSSIYSKKNIVDMLFTTCIEIKSISDNHILGIIKNQKINTSVFDVKYYELEVDDNIYLYRDVLSKRDNIYKDEYKELAKNFQDSEHEKIKVFLETEHYASTYQPDDKFWFSFVPNQNTFYNSKEKLDFIKKNSYISMKNTPYWNEPFYFVGFLQYKETNIPNITKIQTSHIPILKEQMKRIYNIILEKYNIPFYKVKLYFQYPNAAYAQTLHIHFVFIPNPDKDLGTYELSREVQRRNYRYYALIDNIRIENIYKKLEPYFLSPDNTEPKSIYITAEKQKYKKYFFNLMR